MSNDKIKPPSGDELRALCRNASFSASDPASNVECAAAGYRAGWQACAEAMQQDAATLRQAITNIHDRILRGDSDAELMAMCDAALGGTGIKKGGAA